MEALVKAPASTDGWDVTKLLAKLGADFSVEGEAGKTFSRIASLSEATLTDLTFCSAEGTQGVDAVLHSNGGVILCKKELKGAVEVRNGIQLVYVDNPRHMFVRIARELGHMNRRENSHRLVAIAPTTVVSPSTRIGDDCDVGNFVAIGANCEIGEGCIIHDRVTIGPNCKLGDGCIIQSGVTIGEEGFSYERLDSGELVKFPHLRGVIIGDNVEIAANTNIASGSLTDTIISSGTKIDAMVHIAHNVHVGRNCQLTAGTVVGGSAIIGDCCWTGLNCTVKDHARLGNNVIVAAGACVINDVSDGDVVAGVPAKSIKHKVSDPNVFLMAAQKRSEPG